MKRFYFSYGGKTVWKTAPEVTAAAGKDLEDNDFLTRRFAVAALHELHKQEKDKAAVDTQAKQLIGLLDDDDTGVRYWSLATLASLNCRHIWDYCEPIAGRLKDEDCGVRTYAAIALRRVGTECDEAFDYIPDLQDALEDQDPQVRIEATRALVEMIEAEDLDEVAKTHLEALTDRRSPPIFRASAAESIGYLGEAGLPFVENLKNALNDQYPRVREASAKALGNLGIEAMKEVCVKLASMAKSDPVVYVKSASALALKQMDLGQALEHEDASYRAWAAEMISGKGPKIIAHHVPRLGELLQDEEDKVRYWSAWALGDVGESALEYLEILMELAVADPDAETRVAATKACVKLNQTHAKGLGPDIAPTLKHEDAAFRKCAAASLGALGADAVPQAAGLNEALLDKDPSVRLTAVLAIKNAGKQAARACGPNLGECSRTDPDDDVKKWSAFVLYEFGIAARYGAPERKRL